MAIWLWPYADDYIASSIFRGIQRAARGSHVRLVTATAAQGTWEEVLESEAKYIRGLASDEHIDGAILWYLGGERNVPALIEAHRQGVRFVFVDRRPPEGIDADFVGTENVSAAKAAVGHLIDLGHRRIAFAENVDPVSTVMERREGYRRALEEIGQPTPADYIVVNDQAEGELEPVAIRRTAEKLLSLSPAPTAVFAVNDVLAFGLYEAFRDLGVRVPEDISVVGFDGLLRWVPGGGHITTAVQNFTRIGELAAETLLQRFRTPESATYRHILLDAPPFIGGSTGPPKGE
jgi:DNA-binding LacI/PurR family transcriptional regulator